MGFNFSVFFTLIIMLPSLNSYAGGGNCSGSKCLHRGKTVQHHTWAKASDLRSDTFDILHYGIHLDITDFSGQSIDGYCDVKFKSLKNGITTLPLDLLALTIDSILLSGNALNYTYNDTLLNILIPTQNIDDTGTVRVYYNGNPQGDLSGWGGFYFQAGYAFNLGVGFDANPHNFGRVWFPCFDNFVERSAFDFYITTSGGKIATCNGEFQSETVISGDTVMRHWKLEKEIPTYLACVAVADYEVVHDSHSGINGSIPIELYARASDTTALKNSFVNLDDAITAFETHFGAYSWNKVGYSLVPFSSGAMEHATNIAYPRTAANGSLNQETLMAHELAHMWWGDLVTCETQEDMWLNEGMATFLAAFFLEEVYGRESYIESLDADLLTVLRYAHHLEDEYRPVSGIPHQHTYGDHVYKKGALVAHTLRAYMGDAAFFSGMTTFLNNNKFSDVNSYQLRDELSTISGINLTDFFDQWVFGPGFPHFSIDSFSTSSSAPYDVTIYVRQKTTGTTGLYTDVPLEVSFTDANWQTTIESFSFGGGVANESFTFTLNSEPMMIVLNPDHRIAQAETDDQLTINAPGTYTLNQGLMTLLVDAVTDSALVRIEHHWTQPDPIKDVSQLKMALSPNRYWKVDGIFPTGFVVGARISYDGQVTQGNGGYLDNELVELTEDSLFLLYREDPSKDWRVYGNYTKNVLGNSTNQFGIMELDTLLKGEYVLANQDHTVSIDKPQFLNPSIKVYPNPAKDIITLDYTNANIDAPQLHVFSITGSEIKLPIESGSKSWIIHTSELKPGIYFYSLEAETNSFQGRFVISR